MLPRPPEAPNYLEGTARVPLGGIIRRSVDLVPTDGESRYADLPAAPRDLVCTIGGLAPRLA
jgi:hypothetical protein